VSWFYSHIFYFLKKLPKALTQGEDFLQVCLWFGIFITILFGATLGWKRVRSPQTCDVGPEASEANVYFWISCHAVQLSAWSPPHRHTLVCGVAQEWPGTLIGWRCGEREGRRNCVRMMGLSAPWYSGLILVAFFECNALVLRYLFKCDDLQVLSLFY
jgi:predicted nucleic acid-binding Zn ribbon protein